MKEKLYTPRTLGQHDFYVSWTFTGENFDELKELCGDYAVELLMNKKGYIVDRRTRKTIAKPGWVVMAIPGKQIMSFDSEKSMNTYMKEVRGFDKSERSSFKYWFSHWCAFNMTALNLGVWKPRHLFHDFEKPWMKLFCSYKTVQQWHRKHNKHHLEYGLLHGWNSIRWLDLIIDWESCAYTKIEAQLDARETLEYEVSRDKWKDYSLEIRKRMEPILDELGL